MDTFVLTKEPSDHDWGSLFFKTNYSSSLMSVPRPYEDAIVVYDFEAIRQKLMDSTKRVCQALEAHVTWFEFCKFVRLVGGVADFQNLVHAAWEGAFERAIKDNSRDTHGDMRVSHHLRAVNHVNFALPTRCARQSREQVLFSQMLAMGYDRQDDESYGEAIRLIGFERYLELFRAGVPVVGIRMIADRILSGGTDDGVDGQLLRVILEG